MESANFFNKKLLIYFFNYRRTIKAKDISTFIHDNNTALNL